MATTYRYIYVVSYGTATVNSGCISCKTEDSQKRRQEREREIMQSAEDKEMTERKRVRKRDSNKDPESRVSSRETFLAH